MIGEVHILVVELASLFLIPFWFLWAYFAGIQHCVSF